ncbi:alpha/beta hydrolase [Ectothiorhodospiraceae bacterium WFHF3C12]|nr:alpha/beta hydrolase [Ectothiorhodospiraceae bacterium WFHF3C12]
MEPKTTRAELRTDVTLEYVERGDPLGTAVVFLHGLSDSWHSYERVLPHLPESVHAFALTQRGHGDSSKPAAGYRHADFAADVAAFMDEVQLDAAVVVGHSSPGTTAARRFAIDYPERTRGLVLIGSFADMSKNPVVRELWDSVVSGMKDPVDPDFVREFQESTMAQPVPERFLETIVRESAKVPARVWQAVVGGDLQEELARDFGKIKAPTLLLWGDQDEIVPRSDQDAQEAAIPDSRLLALKGVGHAPHWEEPERFTDELVTFLGDAVR